MITYIIRRLFTMIFVVFGATLLLFSLMMTFSPERRAVLYIDSVQQAKDLPRLVQEYGLNDPFWKQYGRWLKNIANGDFGYSTTARKPFWEAFKQYVPVTLELNLFEIPLVITIGIWLGCVAAIRRDTWVDHSTRIGAVAFWSTPTFFFALILLLIFYGILRWLPPGVIDDSVRNYLLDHPGEFTRYTHLWVIDGILNGRLDIAWDALKHLILPVIVSTLVLVAMFVRVMRSSMIEELTKDYVITAIAKGLDRRTVQYMHAKKNAMLPVVTISGFLIAFMIQGNIEVEVIFNRHGLGWWLVESAKELDIVALMGIVIVVAVVFVVANLLVDIICAIIDPRIRLD